MSTLNGALWVLTPLAYMAALLAYRLSFVEGLGVPERRPLKITGIALVLHAGLFAARWSLLGQLPLTTMFDALSALAFLMTITYVLVELATRVSSTGFELLSGPFLLIVYATAFGPYVPKENPRIDDPALFIAHTLPAVGGIAAILVSGVYGILYLRLSHALREKRFGGLFQRMPDLETLAAMNFRAGLIGVVLVTAAIGWGASWYGDQIGRLNVFEPKIFFTLLIWTILLVPVVGKLLRHWNDRWTAILGVISLALVVISWAVSMLPSVGFHGHR